MSGRALFLFLVGTGPCVETAYATERQEAADSTASASTPAISWQAWRATTDPPLTAVQTALRADLIRHVEETVAVRRIEETFPLAGELLDERTFWAAVALPAPYRRTVVVWERTGSGWREVAEHRIGYDVGVVAPVGVEPTHAWMIAKGRSGARGLPTWEVLRFDGESVTLDVEGGWSDVMLVDIDLDGALEILGEEIYHVNCYYCGLSARSVGLYRWNGAQMAGVGFETLPAGAAPAAVVAANNRAAELAGAGRWAEALAVVDGARAVGVDNGVFRRNAGVIDLNAGTPAGGGRRSWDTLLHYVLAGMWPEAVDIFRHNPVLPDFFVQPPPYMDKYLMNRSQFNTPPWLTAVYRATARARTVAPALGEIEFLHAWSAYHLRGWAAYVERLDRTDPSTEWRSWETRWSGLIEPGESVVSEALDKAVALAPHDPLFVEAQRVIARRADTEHADAMRRTFLLLDTGADSCAEPGCMDSRRRGGSSGEIGAIPWVPWQPPDDVGRPLADVPGGEDLARRLAAVYHDDEDSIEQVRAFPLSGSRVAGRTFWAVFDPSADTCRARRRGVAITYNSDCRMPVLAVYEHGANGFRAVTQRRVRMAVVSVIAPVDLEPSQAWIVTRGVNDWNVGANVPHWEIVRFDGQFLHLDVVGNWLDAMIDDVDGDGAREILGSETFPLCYECPVTRRRVRLYRWTGARLVEVPLEMLSSGAASDQAVAANNHAVELGRARRWAEAAAVLDDVRPLVEQSAVFRRNASLIDLNAGTSGGDRFSEDALLNYVFPGLWAEAVGLFRDTTVGPDLFAGPLPYLEGAAGSRGGYGTPPFLRAIFDATAAARAVAPALAEIEFLHAWSAFHLDPDTTGIPSTSWDDSDYRIDVDESALLEVFDRAATLAPDDPLYAETRRVVAERLSH